MPKNEDFLCFNDGAADFYTVDNTAVPGDKPREGLVLKMHLHFGELSIGVHRYYQAMEAKVRIDRLIRTPMRREISTQDVCVIGGKQYRILQGQHKKETRPPSSVWTLQGLEHDYDFGELPGSASDGNT